MDFLGTSSNDKNNNDNNEDEEDFEEMKEEREKYEDYIPGLDLDELKKIERLAKFRLVKKTNGGRNFGKFKKKIYCLMTEPRSSLFALLIWLFLTLVIILSIVVFFIQSWPSFWDKNSLRTTWFLLETFIIAVFTLEFVVRLLTCPNTFRFLISVSTAIDIAAIVPYFAYCILVLTEKEPFDPTWIAILKCFRLFTLIRVIKLGKYTTFFEAGKRAMMKCWDVYILFGIMLLATGFFFCALIFYAEQTQENFHEEKLQWIYTTSTLYVNNTGPFQSVAQSAYWWIVTASTVGYGDQFPVTGLGKFVGGLTILCGVIMFGFPVGVLGVRFSQELDEITLARSRKLYSYKHQNLIAKKRLIKLHKRLRDFRAELLNLRDLYDQLADATSDMIHLVDQGLAKFEE